jgi:hypothetical protein
MDIVTYALAKKYVADTADALGAVRGAPCKIKTIQKTADGNVITFEWKGDSGTTQQSTMVVKDGMQGISISNAVVTPQGHLIISLSDGSSLDCGVVTGSAQLQEPLTATVEIGTITNGKTYAKGTPLEQILRDMLIKYLPPTISLSATPSTKLYDIVTDSVATILLKAAVTKKTNPVTKVAFYNGDTLINEISAGVASGGNFQYQYTPAAAITTDTTFKATATDGKQTSTSTFAIKFVAKSYYGICDANVSDPDETTIKSSTSILKDTKNLTYSDITTDWGKVFYAYPKSFGALTYIKDEVNNINYFDSFQRSEKTVDGIAYYCYTLIDPTAAENNQIVFK